MRLGLAALLVLTALRLALAARLPLVPDEAYYFLWSTHLQPGYFDHPPMVALWIRAGTALFGPSPLGVRLLGPLSTLAGSLLLWDAAERLFPGRRAGLTAAACLNATLLFGAGAVLMTPDTPLLFFWSAGIWAMARLISSGKPGWWLAAGLAAGLALLSKYTGLLFILAVFGWVLAGRRERRWLRTPWPWAAAVLAVLVFAPDIAWNAANGWVSYLKQGGREAGFQPGRALGFVASLLGSQFFLFTPVIAVLAVRGVWGLRHDDTPGSRLLLWLTLLPGAVLLEHVLSQRVEGNWVAVLYPSACIAIGTLPAALLARWRKPAVVLGFGITGLVYVQALAAPLPIPPRMDTAALQMAGWPQFGAQLAALHPDFIVADDYATAAALAYYAPPGLRVVGFEPRWSYFDWQPASLYGEAGIMITHRPHAPCEQIGTLTRERDGKPVQTYRLCKYIALLPGTWLPRP
ncbi:glycosyltransferase family 39 protein [Acidocella aromatica]|uniref:4-amino-4-deoxy-L-arabinose transferase-like glycosyltransferase n=1 Tax=Acidocella aromatica TaxID=1303579 RepID=A0A840V9S4_9PROT|nr:glycosyltransferase family 39 protein [Acidocella aromatica]MBB5372698.1 4-amino-4-deoxy-L-arabinose transferase-like glycosyltransferase [Acidocella aromatica]